MWCLRIALFEEQMSGSLNDLSRSRTQLSVREARVGGHHVTIATARVRPTRAMLGGPPAGWPNQLSAVRPGLDWEICARPPPRATVSGPARLQRPARTLLSSPSGSIVTAVIHMTDTPEGAAQSGLVADPLMSSHLRSRASLVPVPTTRRSAAQS